MVLELGDAPRSRVTDLREVTSIQPYVSVADHSAQQKDSLHSIDHRGRTAHQNLMTLTVIRRANTRRRHGFLDHLLSDKTDTTSPALGRVVEDVLIEEWRLALFSM